MQDLEETLTAKDVSLILHCSLRHAANLIEREMRWINIGGRTRKRLRVTREEFERWEQSRSGGRARTAFTSAVGFGGRELVARGYQQVAKIAKLRGSSGHSSKDKPLIRLSQPRRERP